MATVQVNQTSLFYQTLGRGPTCLVMHGGLGVDHTLYRSLDPLGEFMRLVYYDHRCNGRSGRPLLDTLTMEQLADDAEQLASHLGEGKVVVFGHSFGGFVAQEFAFRHPQRLAGLILCDTTPGQLGTDEAAEEATGPPPPPEFVEMVASPPQSDEELATIMRGMLPLYLHRRDPTEFESAIDETIFNVAAMNRGFEVLSRWSAVDRLNTLDVPTLLLVGNHDVFTSPSQSYRIGNRLRRAELVEFAESGHMPWLDEPDRFFEVCSGWIRHVRL